MENEYNGVETKMHRLDIRANGSSKNDITDKTNDDDSISFQSLIEWELNKRRGRSATYTQPLIHPTNTSIEEEENIVSFLSEFYNYQIYEKCYDMKNILHLYNDTVAIHYNTLVPHTCSFDEFWSRYYYRCSIVQVKKDLLHKQQQQLEQDEKLVDVPIDDDHDPVGKSNSNDTNNEIQSSSMLQQSTPTNKNTNSNTNRIQMFYQEYDRDIIEVIPEDDDENDNDEKDLEQIKL